ncbi:MAG TPA: T9SS type A sorting domain-containing protein [Bacteroidota bacterium]
MKVRHGVLRTVALLFAFACQVTLAQISIQKTDFQKIFTVHATLNFHSDTSKLVNVGKTGGPNVYDFSALTFTDSMTQTLYQSAEVPFLAARFDPSSLFWTNSFPHAYGAPVVWFGTSTFESLCEITLTDTLQEVRYHTPHEIIGQFPFTYNQSWGTTGAGLGRDSLFVNGFLDSTSGGWNGADSTFVDGYGTLILLGQSHQCVRVRQVEVASYTHKGFSYFTKDGIVLLIDSRKDQNDTGMVSVQDINVIAAATVTSVDKEFTAPKAFALEQNYPNPFNPTTTITFSIANRSIVNLKIYDLLGRKVATLVNGEMSAGKHEITLDASRLASGTYFYRMDAGNINVTKKLILLK